jgi:C4-dicarboxylate-specific signal transduction histidine kinase
VSRSKASTQCLVQTAADWAVKTLRDPPEVRFDLPDELEITSRKGQLHQILVNLVQNAADALDGVPGGGSPCRHGAMARLLSCA